MPHGCATCPFCSEPFEEKDGSISYHCRVNVDGVRGKDVSSIVDAMYRVAKKGELITLRPDWCPLVEVPTPHGDLIDRKVIRDNLMYEMVGTGYQAKAMRVCDELYTPTVVEAEP